MTRYYPPKVWTPGRFSLETTVGPTVEPVTVQEIKLQARISDDSEDLLIADYISTARTYVENHTRRRLLNQTLVYKIDRFPPLDEQVFELPGGTAQSITSIQYLDSDGATQTLATSVYETDLAHVPARIGLKYDQDWPTIRDWSLPITITYVAGFGSAATDVPSPLRQAVKLLAAQMFDARCPLGDGDAVELPFGVKAMCAAYKIYKVA